MNLALLEDFDHLYRYADLLELERGIHAERLVGCYTEIMPGRPTIAEHRHPRDSVRKPISAATAAPHHQAERRHYHRRRTADDELLYEHRHLL